MNCPDGVRSARGKTMRRAIVLASGLALLFATLAPIREADAARKVRYPPARLWYRVAIDFEGVTDFPSDLFPLFRFRSTWTLESNHAIRLTLLCVDSFEVGEPEPYFIKRRIRGKLRRVGGCSKPVPNGHGPTVRFAANAAGELASWEHRAIWATTNCGSIPYGSELAGSQELTGSISTPSSLSEGLLLNLDLADPLGPQHFYQDPADCMSPTGPYFDPGYDYTTTFHSLNLFGHDTLIADPSLTGGWRELRTFLQFSFPAGKFGRDLIVTKPVSQPLVPPGHPSPPVGSFQSGAAKEYTYTIRFEACPDRGRDVQSC